MEDAWYIIEGEVVGWLSFSNEGGIGRETMIVRVTKSDVTVSAAVTWYQLRWVGNDHELIKRNEFPRDLADEVEIGDTVRFSTCSREQDDYAVA